MAILHLLATLVVAPYAVLALGFVLVGRVASTQGLWNIVDLVFGQMLGLLSWGVYLFAAVLLAVAAAGFIAPLRLVGAGALVLLAALSLAILLFWRTAPVAGGELLFMLPCAVALGFGAWQLRALLSRAAG